MVSMCHMSSVCCQYVVSMWSLGGWYVVGTVCCQYVSCCQYVVGIVVGIWLLGGW